MKRPTRRTVQWTVADLYDFYRQRRIDLRPEFQRNSIWPARAKAFLADTILLNRPIPLFFLQERQSVQTGHIAYSVIDGQQRLRAIFEFLEDRIRLTQTDDPDLHRKRFSDLDEQHQKQFLSYQLTVEVLADY